MARRARWILLLLPLLVLAATCSKEPEQPQGVPEPAAALQEAVLQLEVTDRAASVLYRPSGRRHVLFEDETVEDSEEGTFHQVLSHFGPYVSYRMEWYYEGGAHPSYGKTYNAVIVGETVEEADLRTLFPEAAIYAALQRTPLVQQTPFDHTNLSGLIKGLAAQYECEMAFDAFFSSFFVKSVKGGTAEVVVGLTHGCEINRGDFTTLTLMMNVADDKAALFGELQVLDMDE